VYRGFRYRLGEDLKMQCQLIFKPMSMGVNEGNRGPCAEISISYPNLEAAILGRDAPPPNGGYTAAKIIDAAGGIHWERAAG
jgi:hypothetical protein